MCSYVLSICSRKQLKVTHTPPDHISLQLYQDTGDYTCKCCYSLRYLVGFGRRGEPLRPHPGLRVLHLLPTLPLLASPLFPSAHPPSQADQVKSSPLAYRPIETQTSKYPPTWVSCPGTLGEQCGKLEQRTKRAPN